MAKGRAKQMIEGLDSLGKMIKMIMVIE